MSFCPHPEQTPGTPPGQSPDTPIRRPSCRGVLPECVPLRRSAPSNHVLAYRLGLCAQVPVQRHGRDADVRGLAVVTLHVALIFQASRRYCGARRPGCDGTGPDLSKINQIASAFSADRAITIVTRAPGTETRVSHGKHRPHGLCPPEPPIFTVRVRLFFRHTSAPRCAIPIFPVLQDRRPPPRISTPASADPTSHKTGFRI